MHGEMEGAGILRCLARFTSIQGGLVFGVASGSPCRTEIPEIVFVAILKHAGASSLVFRCASKKAKQLVDATYFRTCAPRIVVRNRALTADRLARVRRIVMGSSCARSAIVVLSCHVAGSPGSEDITCIKAYLDQFPLDMVELRVSGDYFDACVKRPGDFDALAALGKRISGAAFLGCGLRKWHVLKIMQILPRTLRRLSIESCIIAGPLKTLPKALAWFDQLRVLVIRHVSTYRDDPDTEHRFHFEALAPALQGMRELESLDLHGVISLDSSSALTNFVRSAAARRLRTLRLRACMNTVPVSLVRAIFSLRELRELELSRCRATFELLCEAIGILEFASAEAAPTRMQSPAPALEKLDLQGNHRPSGICPVAAFIRAVPSIKEISLQDTGAIAAWCPLDTGVRFHLSPSGPHWN
jgi:hypothetical protein